MRLRVSLAWLVWNRVCSPWLMFEFKTRAGLVTCRCAFGTSYASNSETGRRIQCCKIWIKAHQVLCTRLTAFFPTFIETVTVNSFQSSKSCLARKGRGGLQHSHLATNFMMRLVWVDYDEVICPPAADFLLIMPQLANT